MLLPHPLNLTCHTQLQSNCNIHKYVQSWHIQIYTVMKTFTFTAIIPHYTAMNKKYALSVPLSPLFIDNYIKTNAKCLKMPQNASFSQPNTKRHYQTQLRGRTLRVDYH